MDLSRNNEWRLGLEKICDFFLIKFKLPNIFSNVIDQPPRTFFLIKPLEDIQELCSCQKTVSHIFKNNCVEKDGKLTKCCTWWCLVRLHCNVIWVGLGLRHLDFGYGKLIKLGIRRFENISFRYSDLLRRKFLLQPILA